MGENDKHAFEYVFGKGQLGRCYGRSITRSYLKKNKEILQIKQHNQTNATKDGWIM